MTRHAKLVAPDNGSFSRRSIMERRAAERIACVDNDRIGPGTTTGRYSDAWRLTPARPEGEEHMQHPSRIGNRLAWLDGREEAA